MCQIWSKLRNTTKQRKNNLVCCCLFGKRNSNFWHMPIVKHMPKEKLLMACSSDKIRPSFKQWEQLSCKIWCFLPLPKHVSNPRNLTGSVCRAQGCKAARLRLAQIGCLHHKHSPHSQCPYTWQRVQSNHWVTLGLFLVVQQFHKPSPRKITIDSWDSNHSQENGWFMALLFIPTLYW